jgi:alanine-synthesizing transaminase
MRFSRRTAWDLRPNALTRVLEEKRRAGTEVVDLSVANPTRVGLAYPEKFGVAWRGAVDASYRPEAFGLLSARQAIGAYYRDKGADLDPASLVLCASTSEAYAFLFKTVADPGDEVLVPRPSYPLFGYLAGLEDVETRTYPLRLAAEGWRVDMDRLAAVVSSRTRAVVLVHPNNPTGSFVLESERLALEELARECGFCLVVDEVFADYALQAPPGRVPTFAAGAGVPTFVLSGLSKVLALPQAKLAWLAVAGPADFKRQALERLEVVADTFLSVGGAVQQALPELLGARAPIQSDIMVRLQQNLAFLRQDLQGQPRLRLLPVEGGWYAVLEVEGGCENLALRLLEECGVLLHPGYFYDFSPDRHLVLSLLTPPDDWRRGIGALGEWAGTALG